MAASDPATDVPTPTGTLQGVAAFSWDGTNWQPTAGAGPAVATPTGALQGVAPFSWSGSAWTPAGRAQPGVATSTGVLDGVAVYTWSGSAWTPASGTATPATPSGALRGVAAFSWDGAAWQPAGQAGPSVATPYGVLAGVAMFNWSGNVWQAGAAVPAGATLDLSFLSGTLDPRITFTRASTATYFDTTGTMQTAAANAPRFDYDPATRALRGLLIEEARTNVLLNTAALGTQGVAVTAQAYTLSFYGTGTVTMSGAFAGSLVGSGAFPARVQTTFTPAAGTLTCTVTGSVLNAQLEAGPCASSYITTVGVAATRAADAASMPTAPWYSATTSALATEAMFLALFGSYQTVATLDDGTTNNFARVYRDQNSSNIYAQLAGGTSYVPFLGTFSGGATVKAAMAWQAGAQSAAFNGALGPGASGALIPPGLTTLRLGALAGSVQMLNGYLRRVRYWPRVLTNAEMQSVTT